MTSFKYKPIGLERTAFRLLKGNNDDPIQCQLFESNFAPPEYVGDYAALSNTWGRESRPMINGPTRNHLTA
jgi:hypothetical protein